MSNGASCIDCKECPRLVNFLDRVREKHPDYHARPVPSFGDDVARLLIVGLAPGMHGANATGRPFTGDYAGILLYQTLFDLGMASHPIATTANDGLVLKGCRITNAVKCLPPENKPTTDEINTCNQFLADELSQLPDQAVVLALGTIAHRSVIKTTGRKLSAFPFAHGAEHDLDEFRLVSSYHCSRYNTQTRRLSREMFYRVMARAKSLADIH
jgi:uracil-DNA glycosylase family 4